MQLYQALELQPAEVISFCGGGGKTSTIQRLCAELRSINRAVISTVTTRIGSDQTDGIEPVLIGNSTSLSTLDIQHISESINAQGWALVAGTSDVTKLTGVDPNVVCSLQSLADYVLVEADGARTMPIKAPAEYEPVVPVCTTLCVVLIGIDAIGRQILPGQVHRPELICKVTGAKSGDVVDPEIIAKLIVHPDGLFKGTPSAARKAVIVNKIVDAIGISHADQLAATLRLLDCDFPVILADTKASVPVLYKH
jgi:probable selenium-dependent hydroxylase accessory protein YqeC